MQLMYTAGSSRLHEFHESKFPFVSRIEFIRSKLSNFSAHVYGSLPDSAVQAGDFQWRLAGAGLLFAPDCRRVMGGAVLGLSTVLHGRCVADRSRTRRLADWPQTTNTHSLTRKQAMAPASRRRRRGGDRRPREGPQCRGHGERDRYLTRS